MKKDLLDLNFTSLEELSSETLDELKGGIASVITQVKELSLAGDGAEYICCINIGGGGTEKKS